MKALQASLDAAKKAKGGNVSRAVAAAADRLAEEGAAEGGDRAGDGKGGPGKSGGGKSGTARRALVDPAAGQGGAGPKRA